LAKSQRPTLSYRSTVRPPALALDEWISVLRASTRLELADARTLSIDKLTELDVEPTMQAVLAQELDVQSWVEPACERLARRAVPLSVEEARVVGLDVAVEVFRRREEERGCAACRRGPSPPVVAEDEQMRQEKVANLLIV
jgi:hypothetical protein